MMKHSYIKPMGLALSLLMSAMLAAQPSASTLPVQGKGAPDAPSTLSIDPVLKVGRASTASASGYSDPDGDPFASWQFEWRSGANGTGTLLGTGASYTPADTSSVYVRVRAQAVRGYPAAQQVGAWREMVYMPVAANQGAVASGGLIYTPPLTQAEADANGVVYDGTYTDNGVTYIKQNWSQGNTYCNNLGNGYRMPNENELKALYSDKGNMRVYADWPVSAYFWSSTVFSVNIHVVFSLMNSNGGGYGDSYGNYVSCVRPTS